MVCVGQTVRNRFANVPATNYVGEYGRLKMQLLMADVQELVKPLIEDCAADIISIRVVFGTPILDSFPKDIQIIEGARSQKIHYF